MEGGRVCVREGRVCVRTCLYCPLRYRFLSIVSCRVARLARRADRWRSSRLRATRLPSMPLPLSDLATRARLCVRGFAGVALTSPRRAASKCASALAASCCACPARPPAGRRRQGDVATVGRGGGGSSGQPGMAQLSRTCAAAASFSACCACISCEHADEGSWGSGSRRGCQRRHADLSRGGRHSCTDARRAICRND